MAVDPGRFADEAQIDGLLDGAARVAGGAKNLLRRDESCILARQADGAAAGLVDPAHQLLVDRAQHHFGDFGRGRIGHAQPIHEAAFMAQPLQHRADLGPSAVHHNRADADLLQQDDVLGEVARQLGVAHRVAAIFHHEGGAGIALQIGQRLDQDFGLRQHLGRGCVAGAGVTFLAHRWPLTARAAIGKGLTPPPPARAGPDTSAASRPWRRSDCRPGRASA